MADAVSRERPPCPRCGARRLIARRMPAAIPSDGGRVTRLLGRLFRPLRTAMGEQGAVLYTCELCGRQWHSN